MEVLGGHDDGHTESPGKKELGYFVLLLAIHVTHAVVNLIDKIRDAGKRVSE